MLRLALALIVAVAAPAAEPHWYRGNTHTHTVLCGHADSTPEVVAAWYLAHGYQFLCLSEHNRFIDPASVKLPEPRRRDFVLVPGEEITGDKVHMTALDTDTLVAFDAKGSAAEIIQRNIDRTRQAHGVPIINHPNFQWQLGATDIRPAERCYLFELYNGHPDVHNDGDGAHPSCEALWDALLDDGMVIYGASSDDAHVFAAMAPGKSNPGRGWVMVRAPELAPRALAQAMDRGDFYASSGVILADVSADQREYRVRVDAAATDAVLADGTVILRRPKPAEAAKPGWRIEFIGPHGAVVRAVDGESATCPRDAKLAWLRCKITCTRTTGDETTQCCAWTQPVFGDGRLAKVADENVRRGWETKAR